MSLTIDRETQNSLQNPKSMAIMQSGISWDVYLKPKKERQREEKMSFKWPFVKKLGHTTTKLNKVIMCKLLYFFRVLETHIRTLKVECRSECIEMKEFH